MLLWLLACADPPEVPEIRINEILPENTTAGGGLVDYEGESADWFELWNASPFHVDLGGMGLTNHPENPVLWTFPEGTVIGADSPLLVFADETLTVNAEIHTPVRLETGVLRLFDADGIEVDGVAWPPIRADHSWARLDDGTWFEDDTPTPLEPNG
ncbi:MAG: lamin tail domain-containing protein [Alphaproteobacteria bacterium]|nr:lamin tail domain-containing protein [Alphaproteobacteria bacterium]